MNRNTPHAPEVITEAIRLLEEANLSPREVARQLNVPRRTVAGWASHFRSGHLRITDSAVLYGDQRLTFGQQPVHETPPAEEPPRVASLPGEIHKPLPGAETRADLTVHGPSLEPAETVHGVSPEKEETVHEDAQQPTAKEVAARRREARQQMRRDALNPPAETDDRATIRELEAKVARLEQQLTWAQHAKSAGRTGGLLTIRRSDDHHGDKNHLLSCVESMTQKLLVLIEQYEPERIQLVGWDDWIAGSGIYKNQDLDMATNDVPEQIAVGAIKTRHYLQAIRSVSSAPIRCIFMRGNHEYAHGVSMAESLYWRCFGLIQDIPDVDLVYTFDNCTVNLAASGYYNVLIRHGFGYSKHSPNSPAFIEAIKDELLVKHRGMPPEQQYRRVLSGHTHWLSVGMERICGFYFDTTGGAQRNTRIRLGDNQRPMGWIVYVSPAGLEGDILRPLEVTPETETYLREIANPHLAAENLKDVGDCLREYKELMEEMGNFAELASFGKVNEGRH